MERKIAALKIPFPFFFIKKNKNTLLSWVVAEC